MQITERDEEALKFLRDIKWSKIDDPKGFKLEFFFENNPYFKNTLLTKTYHMIDEDEPILEKAIGCVTTLLFAPQPKFIDWLIFDIIIVSQRFLMCYPQSIGLR